MAQRGHLAWLLIQALLGLVVQKGHWGLLDHEAQQAQRAQKDESAPRGQWGHVAPWDRQGLLGLKVNRDFLDLVGLLAL